MKSYILLLILLLFVGIVYTSSSITENVKEGIAANLIAAIIIGIVIVGAKPYYPLILSNPLLLLITLIILFVLISLVR